MLQDAHVTISASMNSTQWPAALVVSLGLIASTVIGANTYYRVKSFDNAISVTGSADRTVTSDTVKWTSGFTRTTGLEDLKVGNDKLQDDLKIIKKLFTDRGIKENEITVQPVTTSPICEGQGGYGYDRFGTNCGSNRTVGYTLQQTVIVESKDVEKVTKLSQEGTSILSNSGVIFTSSPIEYYYSKLADLKLDMLAEATNNATARAQKILDATHSKLGKLQNAGMGVFQVTPVNSTEISDYGTYDTSSRDKKVTAIVRSTFSIE